MTYGGLFIIIAFFLIIMIRFWTWPFKLAAKVALNALMGLIMLFLLNYFGAFIGFKGIAINIFTVLIAGLLGVPGVIFLVILKLFL